MNRPLRLGRIDYVNADPFFAASAAPAGIEVVSMLPTRLNRSLLAGDLDLSWISSVELLRNPSKLVSVPPFCIAAPGPVRSVVLASPTPWDHLQGAVIHLTDHSATSVALLKVLLAASGFTCTFETWDHSGPLPEGPVLLIGDEALGHAESLITRHVYDLGERWQQATGCPMVFAVLAMRRELLTESARLDRVDDALRWMDANLAEFRQAPLASPAFRTRKAGLDQEGYLRYFEGFQFRWNTATEAGFRAFGQALLENGLAPAEEAAALYDPAHRSLRPLLEAPPARPPASAPPPSIA